MDRVIRAGLPAASLELPGKLDSLRRFLQFPSANLSPVGSSFPRKEPRAESFSRFRVRVVRNPTAAEPLSVSLLPREGGGAVGDGG